MQDTQMRDVQDLRIQFFDVGQGDGIYIEFPNNVNMLVDLGSTKNKRKVTSPDILTYFGTHTRFKQPGQTLDYLILSHGDSDHYNIVKEFLEKFDVKVKYFMYGGRQDDYHGLIQYLDKRGATYFTFSQFPAQIFHEESITEDNVDPFGGVNVYCFACSCTGPSPTRDAHTKNSDSIVLQLDYNKVRVMLAGDATRTTEWYILGKMSQFRTDLIGSSFSLESNILKVAHHGSARTSSLPGWIQTVNPEFVFISSDRSGALNEEQKTGHRLPQEVTLDAIRGYSKRLYRGTTPHFYVSSYDPGDYVSYSQDSQSYHPNFTLNDPHLRQPDPFDSSLPSWTRGWKQIQTREAIFTTIVHMGGYLNDDINEADQGCQYEVRITQSGDIHVFSTIDFYANQSNSLAEKSEQ